MPVNTQGTDWNEEEEHEWRKAELQADVRNLHQLTLNDIYSALGSARRYNDAEAERLLCKRYGELGGKRSIGLFPALSTSSREQQAREEHEKEVLRRYEEITQLPLSDIKRVYEEELAEGEGDLTDLLAQYLAVQEVFAGPTVERLRGLYHDREFQELLDGELPDGPRELPEED